MLKKKSDKTNYILFIFKIKNIFKKYLILGYQTHTLLVLLVLLFICLLVFDISIWYCDSFCDFKLIFKKKRFRKNTFNCVLFLKIGFKKYSICLKLL
jgi:hypothetical protein